MALKPAPTLADAMIREWLKPIYRQYQANPGWLVNTIAQARKFVLDEKMSAFLADLAYASLLTCRTPKQSADLTDGMRKLSRLPHATTWIEYDHKAKRERAYNEYGRDTRFIIAGDPDKGPDRCGWLCVQHPKIETAFMAIECASHAYGGKSTEIIPVATPHCFTHTWRTDDEPTPWAAQEQSIIEVVGSTAVGVVTGVTNYTSKSVAVIPSPHLKLSVIKHYIRKSTFNPLAEIASDLRYLWALLATINDLPTNTVDVVQSHGYIARGKYRKFCDHKIITLNIPEKRYKRIAAQAIAHARRRAHMVRGHWRVNRWHPGERIWIREHERGDASIGFVMHDYVVEHEVPQS